MYTTVCRSLFNLFALATVALFLAAAYCVGTDDGFRPLESVFGWLALVAAGLMVLSAVGLAYYASYQQPKPESKD